MGAPGSPVQVLQTKHLNLELGHFSGFGFVFAFPWFQGLHAQQGCWSRYVKALQFQTSTGIPAPPAVSEHTPRDTRQLVALPPAYFIYF